MKKVAVVRKGDFYIYAYDLILELSNNNTEVTAIVCIDKSEENLIYDDLINRICQKVRCLRLLDLPKGVYLRAKAFLNKLRLSTNFLIVSPYLIYKTRKKFRKEKFDYIIAVGQESLYWAYQSFKRDRKKIIYYNLEVIYKGHPSTKDPTWARIVAFERKVLAEIGGVIIQDKFRADVLIGEIADFNREKLIYFPVCINEDKVITKGGYLRTTFSLSDEDIVVLYFGGIWPGRFLNEIIDGTSSLPGQIKIVIHGGRGSFGLESDKSHIIVSTEKLLFSRVTDLISSAHIGLAFYSADNYNDKYTAYSSEKISRYCQCGIPFIAFENENYLYFKEQYDCCMLIADVSQLSEAIRKILDNYPYYQKNAYRAFDAEFDYKKRLKTIINFLNK